MDSTPNPSQLLDRMTMDPQQHEPVTGFVDKLRAADEHELAALADEALQLAAVISAFYQARFPAAYEQWQETLRKAAA